MGTYKHIYSYTYLFVCMFSLHLFSITFQVIVYSRTPYMSAAYTKRHATLYGFFSTLEFIYTRILYFVRIFEQSMHVLHYIYYIRKVSYIFGSVSVCIL